MIQMKVPKQVQTIIHTLEDHGFSAYIVGGCVRDTVLGRKPEDWDITTQATPQQVKQLFRHTVDTGIQHGTVSVISGKAQYEVTTYRIDGEYLDARHPKEVIFTPSLTEDLRRRDFTINAMAYNEREGIIDLFGGMDDLEAGLIRCVGNPIERFSEDALRMLRAHRFAAQLGFSIVPDTFEAICALSSTIQKVSAERIQSEMIKLLCSAHPDGMRQVYESGLAAIFLPEFCRMMETEQNTKHHAYTVGEHTLQALKHIKADRVLRLAVFFHDIGKPACKTTDCEGIDHFHGHADVGAEMARVIMRRLKMDNETIRRVTSYVRAHELRPELIELSVRRSVVSSGPDNYPGFFRIKYADIMGQSLYQQEEKLALVARHEEIYKEIIEKKQCLRRADLAVNGKDLIALGIPKGKEIGVVLDQLLDYVVEVPERNEKDVLLEYAREQCL